MVRIKLKIEDYEYIKSAKRMEFDGRMFHIESDPRPHGLFDVIQFVLYFLDQSRQMASPLSRSLRNQLEVKLRKIDN